MRWDTPLEELPFWLEVSTSDDMIYCVDLQILEEIVLVDCPSSDESSQGPLWSARQRQLQEFHNFPLFFVPIFTENKLCSDFVLGLLWTIHQIVWDLHLHHIKPQKKLSIVAVSLALCHMKHLWAVITTFYKVGPSWRGWSQPCGTITGAMHIAQDRVHYSCECNQPAWKLLTNLLWVL